MISKIVVGVLALATVAAGAVVYRQQTGCCPLAAIMGHTSVISCPGNGGGCPNSDEGCKPSQTEPASCCQQPSRTTLLTSSEPNCCADLPASVIKGAQETLLIEPREVK